MQGRVIVLCLSLLIVSCSFTQPQHYEVTESKAAQVKKLQLIDFEKARVQKELAGWD